MEVLIQRGDSYHPATLPHRNLNVDVELIGLHNTNLILYTRLYESIFPGGEVVEVLENQVAEFILISCDA